MIKNLTAAILREALHYNPETGAFTRLERFWGRASNSHKIGCLSRGYLVLMVRGRMYLAHRLAWLYMTGQWPDNSIDHIDCNKSNNKFSNLRDIPGRVQQQNFRNAKKNSTSQVLGVRRQPGRKNYEARIRLDGKDIYIGTFESETAASAAYVAAKRQLHPYGTL